MHVIPLPFGLALALMPRRDVERLRRREEIRPHIRNAVSARDRILTDMRYFHPHA
jgi:hypothetical protein